MTKFKVKRGERVGVQKERSPLMGRAVYSPVSNDLIHYLPMMTSIENLLLSGGSVPGVDYTYLDLLDFAQTEYEGGRIALLGSLAGCIGGIEYFSYPKETEAEYPTTPIAQQPSDWPLMGGDLLSDTLDVLGDSGYMICSVVAIERLLVDCGARPGRDYNLVDLMRAGLREFRLLQYQATDTVLREYYERAQSGKAA